MAANTTPASAAPEANYRKRLKKLAVGARVFFSFPVRIRLFLDQLPQHTAAKCRVGTYRELELLVLGRSPHRAYYFSRMSNTARKHISNKRSI
jgi:hypothetical protein